jgi:hypothetical protein
MKLSQSFLSPVLLLLLGSIGDAQNVGTSDFEAVLAEQPDFSEFKAILDSRQQEKNLMLQGIAQNSDSGQTSPQVFVPVNGASGAPSTDSSSSRKRQSSPEKRDIYAAAKQLGWSGTYGNRPKRDLTSRTYNHTYNDPVFIPTPGVIETLINDTKVVNLGCDEELKWVTKGDGKRTVSTGLGRVVNSVGDPIPFDGGLIWPVDAYVTTNRPLHHELYSQFMAS